MSALAVALSAEPQAPSLNTRHTLDALLTRQRESGPDGKHIAGSGACFLGVNLLVVNPEDETDPPCIDDAESGLVVAVDGALANREELLAALGLSAPAERWMGDARLVARAWRRWGVEAAARLEGELCAAVWDAAAGCCHLVRDVFGFRPVYYRHDRTGVAIASELRALRTPASPINEGIVAEALADRPATREETFFSDIRSLPPAHVLQVTREGRCTTRRYWQPDLERTAPLASDEEYAEQLREHLARGVRRALRSARPTAVLLSGGLDSSCVTAAAVAVATADRRDMRRLSCAATVTFPDPTLNEAAWAKLVATHTGTAWATATACGGDFDYLQDARRSLQLPCYPTGANAFGLRSVLAGSGHRVLLNGLGADEWFYGSNWCYADHLRKGHLRRLLRDVRADARLEVPSIRSLLRDTVLPHVPRRHWRRLGRLAGRAAPRGLTSPALAARVGLEDRLEQDRLPAAPFHSRRDIARELTSGMALAAREDAARLAARTLTVDRHPFYDRPLVEFALSLPDAQRRSEGIPKRVLRRAFQRQLPQAVVDRVEHFDYSCVVRDVAKRLLVEGGVLARPTATWHVVQRGWVDEKPLTTLAAHVCERSERSVAAGVRLWPTLAVELWARAT